MPTFEHTIEIAAPRDRVFEFGMDPHNWERSTPGLTDVREIEETDDGLRLKGTWTVLGRSIDGDMEMTVLEPNAHTVTRFDSPGMTGELHFRFEDVDGGTRVIQQADYEFGDSLLEKVMEPVAKRFNKRQFKNSLETMKELIEAETTAEVRGGTVE